MRIAEEHRIHRRFRRTLRLAARVSALAVIMFPASALAQMDPGRPGPEDSAVAGRIVGRIMDARTGRPLATAQVLLVNGSAGGLTAVDGRYVLEPVLPGRRAVKVQLMGYATKTVTDVEVLPGATVLLDIALEPEALALEGITVSAAAERGSTTSLLSERRAARTVVDAMGAEQIARTPDGDAAAALKRVPGLTVVDGRFPYVRGLGDRYTATTLNGAPLASPVPDRRAVPLDVIPSTLLESIVTSKSFAPDLPGDFAGGVVQLRTRSFPSRRTLNLGLSGGWNSATSFREGLFYRGGSLDLLGVDDGTRGIPSVIPRNRPVDRSTFSSARLAEIGRSFSGAWAPTPQRLPPNFGVSLAAGDEFTFGDHRRVGLVATANYSADVSARRNLVERVFATAGGRDPEVDYRGELTKRSIVMGALVSATVHPRPAHEIKLTTLYNRRTEDVARVLQGFNLDSNTDQWNSRLRFQARSLVNGQLRGRHALAAPGGADLEWTLAYSRAVGDEPGTREVLYREFDGRMYWDDFIQSGSIFHQRLTDAGPSASLNVSFPFEAGDRSARIAFGAQTDRKDRKAYTRRFRFRPAGPEITSEVRALDPNALFTPEHIGPDGFEIQEATFRTDNYDARFNVDAAYVLAELEPVPGLRFSGGVRMERTVQEVHPRDLWDTGIAAVEGAELHDTDLLPALNVTWAPSGDMNLRLGVSRTLARPQLRELAPFSFADYAGGFLVIGNPRVRRARIRNVDLRWEWFPSPTSVVSVSGFWKRFDDPIEVTVLPSSELIKTWVNSPEAESRGVELEARAGLGALSQALAPLRVNVNLTLVDSNVRTGGIAEIFLPGTGLSEIAVVDRDRALQGQSPLVANVGLTWAVPDRRTSVSLLFNHFGRRIDAVGGQATPDVFEEGRSQLDLTLRWPLAERWTAKLSASRLLGARVEFTQGGEVLRAYDVGRTLSVSINWAPVR